MPQPHGAWTAVGAGGTSGGNSRFLFPPWEGVSFRFLFSPCPGSDSLRYAALGRTENVPPAEGQLCPCHLQCAGRLEKLEVKQG